MKWHPANAASQDFMPGACFKDTFGIGQATQAATTAASTAAQMALTKTAMDRAAKTGTGQAQAISTAGADAQKYYDPYVSAGNALLGSMTSNPAYGTTDNSYVDKAENALTQSTLEQTPGYQWQYSQGMQAATNSAAARGLANSGAAMKGASTFANGLADSTYQNQFNDQLAANSSAQGNLQNTFTRQNALLGYGANAASASANNETNTALNSASAQMAGVGASMSGTASMANSLTNGLTGFGNQAGNYSLYRNLLSGNSGDKYGGDIGYGTAQGF